MATKGTNPKVTQDMIDAVLAQMTPDQLSVAASEKRMETVKEDIELYLKTEEEQTERLNRIRLADPKWKPPTVADRIVSLLTEKGSMKIKDISEAIGSPCHWRLKKMAEEKTLTFDTKTEEYSMPEEKPEAASKK